MGLWVRPSFPSLEIHKDIVLETLVHVLTIQENNKVNQQAFCVGQMANGTSSPLCVLGIGFLRNTGTVPLTLL